MVTNFVVTSSLSLSELPKTTLKQVEEFIKYNTGIFSKDSKLAETVSFYGVNDNPIVGEVCKITSSYGIKTSMSIFMDRDEIETMLMLSDYIIIITNHWKDMWSRHMFRTKWKNIVSLVDSEKVKIWVLKEDSEWNASSHGSPTVM